MSQILRFGLVGLSATALHIFAGSMLIWIGTHPLIANTIAFAVAFSVSFLGHSTYSFSGHTQRVKTAFVRFVAVALSGFTLNQAMLASLLFLTPLPATAALCLSTIVSAMWGFVWSKLWTFQSRTRTQ
jgi:putative flippase GtrA